MFNAAQTSVSNWELGIREAPYEILVKMADYFGVSVDYLLGRTDQKEKPAIDSDDELTKEFVELFMNITPEQQDAIISTMKTMQPKK